MPKKIDRVGLRYGRLSVLSEAKLGLPSTSWHCRCDCGSELVVRGVALVTGNTRSCGCLRKDLLTTHGAFRNAGHDKEQYDLYRVWSAMKDRCYNGNHKNFQDYGGREISVCQEWRESFEKFRDDMGPRPTGSELDRVNNNGNYSPDNCRWATVEQQQNNKRGCIYVMHNGAKVTVMQCAKAERVGYRALLKAVREGAPDVNEALIGVRERARKTWG